MNFDAPCVLPSGMTYEPPAAWNWCGPTENTCSYYSQQPEPTFGLQFAQQPRATFFQDIGISPYSSPGEIDYCPSGNRLALLGNGAVGCTRNGTLGVKDEPQPDSSNDSARCYIEPSRPLTGGSSCDRIVHSDPPGTVQCTSSSSSNGNLMDISSSQGQAINKPSPTTSTQASEACGAARKKRDRFNGMTDEEVLKLTVPDQLCENLDMVIIGISPGMTAAYLGHHYAGPGNHFWKCLYLSGLIPEPMSANDDYRLKEIGIGFTNFISRCSKGSVELTRREMKEGAEILTAKIQRYRPKIAVFNGKGIYEMFCNHKNFYIGKQPEPFPGTDTVVYVMPSSSARCSQLPRASDKVPFFVALRKLRDHVCGRLQRPLDESEVVFPDLDLKVEPRRDRRQASTSSSASGGVPIDLPDRKRHYREDDEGTASCFPPAQNCEVVPSPPQWPRQNSDISGWSPYPGFTPNLTDCTYSCPKMPDGPLSYNSCLPDSNSPFVWNNATSRWPASSYSAYAQHVPSLDRPFLPDPGNGLVPKSAYGALPAYPYEPPSLSTAGGFGLLSDRSSAVVHSSRSQATFDMLSGSSRMGPAFPVPDRSGVMNSARSPGAFDMLSSCGAMLRCYPH